MRRLLLLVSATLIATFHLSANVFAQEEEILSYETEIHVQPNSELLITEVIKVQAWGINIRRGIYRDFPTDYRDRFGHKIKVGFQVLKVERDGHREPWHQQKYQNGERIYIGDKDVFLKRGVYTYTLQFRTTRQLGYFEKHDELYFNAIGHGWVFPIEHVNIRVFLPPSIPGDSVEKFAYTGFAGSTGSDYNVGFGPQGEIIFSTTKALMPYQGVTIVVTWPKGYVQEPSTSQKLNYFFEDNIDTLVISVGFLLLLGYMYYAWNAVGKDPPKGVIIPLFKPPASFSPADCRYVSKMGFDKAALTSTIINLAVNGYLTISKSSSTYSLERTKKETSPKNAEPPPEEEVVLNALFLRSNAINLSNTNHSRIQAALKQCEASLKSQHESRLFYNNRFYLLPAFAIAIAAWIIAAGSVGFEISRMASLFTITSLAVYMGSLLYFIRLIKSPTLIGRKVMDQIEGLKMYLSTAEKDRLNLLNPPEETPEVFEHFLPYAYALGVEQQWSDRFAAVLAAAAVAGQGYQPTWIRGSGFNTRDIGSITNSVGSSLNSAIASAATPPGSSSGSGGGGFSGGGGGGGGGGGW